MKLFYFILAFLALGTTSLSAQPFEIEHLYPIETSHSFIEFEVTYMGYAKVKGSFSDFYGSIYYNPAAPDQTSVTFQIDVESIDTNNDWRDRDLKSGNWFLAEEYPYIRFTSVKVEPQGGAMLVAGDLNIKDTVRRITFTIPPPQGVILDMRDDDQVIFVGVHTINRKEYGVMGKNWSQVKEGIAALSDEVTIEFSLLGKQINASNFSNFLRNPKSPPGSIHAVFKEEGIKAALQQYEKLLADTSVSLNANALNMVGYLLMMQEKYEEAQAVLERNLSDFPDVGNVYDSLGELAAKTGQLEKAKEFYKKSLELDPKNMNAVEVLKHLTDVRR